MNQTLPIQSFSTRDELRQWLVDNHSTSSGMMVRLYRVKSGVPSVTFRELLEEGLCFGWSESQRLPFDEQSYLQKFTPRKSRGTNSERNKRLAQELEKAGLMTEHGRTKL